MFFKFYPEEACRSKVKLVCKNFKLQELDGLGCRDQGPRSPRGSKREIPSRVPKNYPVGLGFRV